MLRCIALCGGATVTGCGPLSGCGSVHLDLLGSVCVAAASAADIMLMLLDRSGTAGAWW
jgi:hypothetical protein